MHRLSTLALAAGLLLTAVAATPPTMPQNPPGGQAPPAGPVGPPMMTPAPYGAPAPATTPSPNPQMLARAKSWFAQLQAGKIDRSQLAPGMGSLTDEQVTNVSAQIKSLGTPVTFEQQQTMTQNGVDYAIYLLTFGDGKKLDFIFAVDGQGKVAGLRLQPAP
jgi:hypothetical protein